MCALNSQEVTDLHVLVRNLELDSVQISIGLISNHLRSGASSAAMQELNRLKQGHDAYLSLKVDPEELCGLGTLTTAGSSVARPSGRGEMVLSSMEHFAADVVVVRCMDNRCSSPNVELNKQPTKVCEIVSAGHILTEKDLESIAVGLALKGAKVILVEAHGGECGALKLALTESVEGRLSHAMTKLIGTGLSNHTGTDTPDVFLATLENLDRQIGKILDPGLEIPLLRAESGKGSFHALMKEGRCIVLGAYVDFEVFKQKNSAKRTLMKRLTFFDSSDTLSNFLEKKLAGYIKIKGED